ncbi:MAG: ammonium transporter [Caldilineaceae bacterium]|nr:ammonium transporter [Caldilineaceae bacterium]MCY4116183.1 ammonium transporter [Caldilineaceae bacterium]MDE0070379.1 ammonium transporter [Caldilineaceae bacterium]MDE0180821.1 ammonium transporter [Caldilineaceae bacterium]MDE0429152.1 ammonium transporter [Caldilineaceae bacterium]
MEGINSGDTAWIIVATALVLMMTPALGFFYGGMVRRKNILSTLNLSFITIGLISIQWVIIGYSLAFGESVAGLVGGLNYLGLSGIGLEDVEGSIPKLLFVAFQMTFAIITPALISGTFVERIRFKVYLVFTLLWATLVYDPVCHWAWGGGIFSQWGALDFAGGTVVHITAGFSALAFSMAIRKRKGFGQIAIEPHNIAFTVLGAGLLWVGWFGFNGGSALAADGLAVQALLNTNTAAAAAAVVWMFLSWRDNKPSVLGIVTGAVVGLVAITPAAGFVNTMSALLIGAIAAPVSYYSIDFRERRGLDESLDVWACHGMAGAWGALATGLFATAAVGGVDGLFYGNAAQFGIQLITVVVTIAYSVIITFALTKILDAVWGLAVSEQEEEIGLDISEHGERAYA